MRAFFIPPARRQAAAPMLLLSLLLALLMSVLLALPGPAAAAALYNDAVPPIPEEQTIMQAESDSRQPAPDWNSAASGRVHIDRHFLGQYGAAEQAVILQRGGNAWRVLRNGPMAAASGAILLGVPLLLLGFYLFVRPQRAEGAGQGRRLLRFTSWQRLVHWATAISFLVMAVTGLLIMFGKQLLIPLMGHDAFSWVAIISKYLHNFVGPLFIICSVVMFITYVHKNFFRRWDWQWIKSAGGLVGHKHVPADYFNAGEKLWFWGGVVLLGLLMSVTGLVLNFVNWGQTRYVLQVADILHIAGATLYIAAAMGHIYIGTLGTPGAYEGMRHGTVSAEWAREHHEIWYEQVKDTAAAEAPPQRPVPPGARPGPAH